MGMDKEIIGGADHGKGTLILHRWKRYAIGTPGSLHYSHGYQSACGRAVTGRVLDLGEDAGRCGVCFKRPNTRLVDGNPVRMHKACAKRFDSDAEQTARVVQSWQNTDTMEPTEIDLVPDKELNFNV